MSLQVPVWLKRSTCLLDTCRSTSPGFDKSVLVIKLCRQNIALNIVVLSQLLSSQLPDYKLFMFLFEILQRPVNLNCFKGP